MDIPYVPQNGSNKQTNKQTNQKRERERERKKEIKKKQNQAYKNDRETLHLPRKSVDLD